MIQRDELYLELQNHSYPPQAVEKVMESYQALHSEEQIKKLFEDFTGDYKEGSLDYNQMITQIAEVCKVVKVNHYTAYLIFYIGLLPLLKEKYSRSGVSMEVYRQSIMDIPIKVQECFHRYGVWGIFDVEWIWKTFQQELYILGRLQFELYPLPWDAVVGGISFDKGHQAVFIHIPSGTKLLKEDCIDAFKEAKGFYGLEQTLFICDSWLLNPFHPDFLDPKSNILMFMDFFEKISSREDKDFLDAWRIFGKEMVKPYHQMPQKTPLQRAYILWVESGNHMVIGVGGFVE